MSAMTALVVDASAIVELVLTTATGRLVATALNSNQTIHAPELIGVEIVSVLRRLTRIGELSAEEGRQALIDFDALGVELYEHQPLLTRAFELRESVTAYDAMYLALAEALKAPLLTCDVRLAGSNGHRVVILCVSPS
jgi:predicted nucleic acid-binding protein